MNESSNFNKKPALITEMDAFDLVGRLVTNEHGAEFAVTRLIFDANTASVVICVAEFDDEGELEPDSEVGLSSINGWSIHQKDFKF